MYILSESYLLDDLLTAGHDVSDGGVLICLLEMAFAGNCGVDVNFLCSNVNDQMSSKLI